MRIRDLTRQPVMQQQHCPRARAISLPFANSFRRGRAFKSFSPLSITLSSSFLLAEQAKDHKNGTSRRGDEKTSSSIYIVQGSKNIFLPLSQALHFFSLGKISFCFIVIFTVCVHVSVMDKQRKSSGVKAFNKSSALEISSMSFTQLNDANDLNNIYP